MLAHAGRHPFLYLSLALHALLFAALYGMHLAGGVRMERDREQRLVDTGQRLTERAGLEKRVQDMARIKSLLEESAAPADGPRTSPPGGQAEDGAQSGMRHETPGRLLERAGELARAIDTIEQEVQAAALAQLLGIPKAQASARLAQERKPAEALAAAPAAPRNAAEAAARIGELETRARAALERRRRELERQRDGTPVAAGPARAGRQRQDDGSRRDGDGVAAGGQGLAAQGKTGGVALASMLDRIEDISRPELADQATKAYAGADLQAVFDRGTGRMPDVGAGATVKGAGSVIGPGGPYADRVFVDRWYLIGPFAGRHGVGLVANHRHPPEQAVVLDAAYRGKDGRLLRWEYVDAARYPLVPPVSDEDAVYYGYTEVMMDEDRDLAIWVGADDDAQLWLNDRLVWRGGNVDKGWFFGKVYDTWNTRVRDYNLSEGKRVVHFRKGRNKLFFKLSNGPTRLFFSLVLTK